MTKRKQLVDDDSLYDVAKAPRVFLQVKVLRQNQKGLCLVSLHSYDGAELHASFDPKCILEYNPQTGFGKAQLPCLTEHDDFSILLLPAETLETQTRFVKVRSEVKELQ